jgi:hypothetical protein
MFCGKVTEKVLITDSLQLHIMAPVQSGTFWVLRYASLKNNLEQLIRQSEKLFLKYKL